MERQKNIFLNQIDLHPLDYFKIVKHGCREFLYGHPTGHTPRVEYHQLSELKLVVNPQGIFYYISKMKAPVFNLGSGDVAIGIMKRLNSVQIVSEDRIEDIENEEVLGRLQLLFGGTAVIEIATDRNFKEAIKNGPHTPSEEMLLFPYFDDEDFDTIYDFWETLDPDDPNDWNVPLNLTALHEIRHIRDSVIDLFHIFGSVRLAESEIPDFKDMPTETAWREVLKRCNQRHFFSMHTPEGGAIAYSLSNIRSMRRGETPWIVRLKR